MSTRTRARVFCVVAVLIVGSVVGFLMVRSSRSGQVATDPAVAITDATRLAAQPRIVFRNMTAGSAYGRVAMVALDDPGGSRTITDLSCDRVDAHETETLCLVQSPLAATFDQRVIDRGAQVLFNSSLPGLPSRARFSPDGAKVAATGFVAGDSYLDVGFSTRTYITQLASGAKYYLEDFSIIHNGQRVRPVDRNFWGVTFLDDDAFYVTVGFGGDYWLAKGSISSRTVETVHDRAECPSISPDHKRIVYKKRQSGENEWRLAVLDLATRQERILTETRSVDDQVEWLDVHTILYALPPVLARDGDSDVWSLDIDEGQPKLLIHGGASPSVVAIAPPP